MDTGANDDCSIQYHYVESPLSLISPSDLQPHNFERHKLPHFFNIIKIFFETKIELLPAVKE